MLRQEVVVMNVSRYDMVNRETGEQVKGSTVRYALTNELFPYEEDNLKGYKLGKTPMKYEDYSQFPVVPGIYECDLKFNINTDGNVRVSADKWKFVRPLVAQNQEKKQ